MRRAHKEAREPDEIGRALALRVTPELRFEYDTTPDRARRVDTLLDEVRRGPQKDGEDES